MKVDQYKNTHLYPPTKYNKKYMLKVSDIHTIAFFTYGNEKGNTYENRLLEPNAYSFQSYG